MFQNHNSRGPDLFSSLLFSLCLPPAPPPSPPLESHCPAHHASAFLAALSLPPLHLTSELLPLSRRTTFSFLMRPLPAACLCFPLPASQTARSRPPWGGGAPHFHPRFSVRGPLLPLLPAQAGVSKRVRLGRRIGTCGSHTLRHPPHSQFPGLMFQLPRGHRLAVWSFSPWN